MWSAVRVEVTAPSSTPAQANTLEASSTRLEHSGPTTLLAVQWQINISVKLFCSKCPVQNIYVINLMQKWVLKSTCHNANTIKDEDLSCFDELLFSWLLASCIIWKASCLLPSLPPLHRKQVVVVLLHLPWTFFCLVSYQKAFWTNENFSWMLDWSPGLMITMLYLCKASTLQAWTERRTLFSSVSSASYWQ